MMVISEQRRNGSRKRRVVGKLYKRFIAQASLAASQREETCQVIPPF
jgi:hypothetical protein